MVDYVVPVLLFAASAFALRKRENSYELLLRGGAEGLKLLLTLIPALVMLLCAVRMLQASGTMELISRWCAPAFRFFGIPPECAMLVLVRPISGSAALAVGAELMGRYGVDSTVGRTAAVMLGSTETTFYVLTVYFAGIGNADTKRILPAALLADLVGFVMAAVTVQQWF